MQFFFSEIFSRSQFFFAILWWIFSSLVFFFFLSTFLFQLVQEEPTTLVPWPRTLDPLVVLLPAVAVLCGWHSESAVPPPRSRTSPRQSLPRSTTYVAATVPTRPQTAPCSTPTVTVWIASDRHTAGSSGLRRGVPLWRRSQLQGDRLRRRRREALHLRSLRPRRQLWGP